MECRGQVGRGGNNFLLLKCIFYRLSKVHELAFGTSVPPEGGLFSGDQVIGFLMLHRPPVDHVLRFLLRRLTGL